MQLHQDLNSVHLVTYSCTIEVTIFAMVAKVKQENIERLKPLVLYCLISEQNCFCQNLFCSFGFDCRQRVSK